MTKEYVKHLIECNCILPQFKNIEPDIFHKFAVFNELEDETAKVVESFAQCPNCGAVHKVTEVGKSTILGKETSLNLPAIDEMRVSLPSWLSNALDKYGCDIPTWQEAKFIFENQLWGRFIVLAKEREEEKIFGKIMIILGETLHKIESFTREDGMV